MKIGILAKILDYDLVGNPELEITGISYAKDADKTMIALIKKKKEIEQTEADAVVTEPCFINTEKTLLFSYDDINYAMIKICRVLIDQGVIADYSKPVAYEMTEQNIGLGKNVSLAENVLIEPNVFIGNDVAIGKNTIISSGVKIGSGTRIGKNVSIASGTVVGADSFFHFLSEQPIHFQGIGKTIIGDGVHIGSNCVIQRGTVSDTKVGSNCMIGNCIDIGHDVVIGKNCKIVSQSGIAGNAVIGDRVIIYGQAGIVNDVKIGNNVIVKAKTLVSKPVPDHQTVFGIYGREVQKEMKLQAKIRRFFERKE